jgi:hypothetical protein
LEQKNYESSYNFQGTNFLYCNERNFFDFSEVKQTNHKGSNRNIQTYNSGNFASINQSNKEGSFENIQRNLYGKNGAVTQNNEDHSAGNMQINRGGKGIKAIQYIGQGYSFNLQMNILECGPGEKDKIGTLRGNIRIDKCTDDDYIYHDDGDAIYQVYYNNHQVNCNNYKFIGIRDRKVHVIFCVLDDVLKYF